MISMETMPLGMGNIYYEYGKCDLRNSNNCKHLINMKRINMKRKIQTSK